MSISIKPTVFERIYAKGILKKATLTNGTILRWHSNGKRALMKQLNGAGCLFDENGSKIFEKLEDGTRRVFKNGLLEFEHVPNKIMRFFDKKGMLKEEQLSNGTVRLFKEGKVIQECLKDGAVPVLNKFV